MGNCSSQDSLFWFLLDLNRREVFCGFGKMKWHLRFLSPHCEKRCSLSVRSGRTKRWRCCSCARVPVLMRAAPLCAAFCFDRLCSVARRACPVAFSEAI
ncbi:hypothetical protein Taro_013813 [Colocasia esculenta]|uniref:Uncharacterized protein n=1 Tax=Colocasia esculenta TaxID=4460 RepID=A0A843UJU8_COLES|nr:hypothetical protein [Colocasia esculenta]